MIFINIQWLWIWMEVIYLKCGGRLRVWIEPGIVASLLGAIRIQLIMMIYVRGYYVRGRTEHFLWGMIINTTQSRLSHWLSCVTMWLWCQVWLTRNVITPRSRKLGSKFLLVHGTVAHFYLFVPFLCLHLSWPPVQIRKKLIGFHQAGNRAVLFVEVSITTIRVEPCYSAGTWLGLGQPKVHFM